MMLLKTTRLRKEFDEIFGKNIICGDEISEKKTALSNGDF